MSETVYLKCSAKERAGKFRPKLCIGVKATDLIEFAKQHANARGYVNLLVTGRKEVGAYGDTHSVTLDTYEPKANRDAAGAAPPMGEPIDESDIPF